MPKIKHDEIEKFHDYNIYAQTRTLYLGSEDYFNGESGVDGAMAARLIKNLTILEAQSSDPITIITNNIGGDVQHGLAIYDAIKACKSKVTMKVFGNAASMGSIILQAADDRIMATNSILLIHYGQLGVSGEALTVYKHTEENKRIDRWMEELFMSKIREKNPKFTLKRLQALLKNDTFYTAAQTVELGLADKVLGDE